MRTLHALSAPLKLCLSLLSLALLVRTVHAASSAAQGGTPPAAQTKHYVCPPCGLPCDSAVFDKPGVCPQCGMALVDQETAAAAAQASKKVAFLIFNGVEIIDYTGPYEIFGAAGFEGFTVAETKEPITTAMGMTVVPKYTFGDAPQPDVLVVPGGSVRGTVGSAATLKWVADTTARAQHTMSVCNGAFILAKAGLLDGLSATTTFSNIESLRSSYPKIKVVDDRRFVDNGKIITTGGLTAGIDGALHVVSKMLGHGNAQKVALDEEYDWRPSPGFARAALADRLIPDVNLDGLGKWDLVSTEGGTDRWEMVARGTSDKGATELMERIGGTFETAGKWTRAKATATATRSASVMSRRWTFNGRDGKPWSGVLTIQPVSGGDSQYMAKLTIARAG